MNTYNELNPNSPLCVAILHCLAKDDEKVVVQQTEQVDPNEMENFLKTTKLDLDLLIV